MRSIYSRVRASRLLCSRQTHRHLRPTGFRSFSAMYADPVQGDAAPGSFGPVASLGLQGSGQADQARGVGRGRIDPDGVVAVLLVEGREGSGQQGGMSAGRWDSRGAGPGSRHHCPNDPQALEAAISG